jgi:toxin ParE1/3/4
MSSRKYEVRLTEVAEADLESLYKYVLTTRSDEIADDLLNRIDQAIESLQMFPERGAYPSELANTGITEIRQLVYWPYRIIYEVFGRKVEILAIVDGRRDMRSLLQKRLMQR